jgi:hypothetical protein
LLPDDIVDRQIALITITVLRGDRDPIAVGEQRIRQIHADVTPVCVPERESMVTGRQTRQDSSCAYLDRTLAMSKCLEVWKRGGDWRETQ